MINPLNFSRIKGHGNIRSIFNKFLQLKHYLLDSNITCLVLSETWLMTNIPDNMLYIPGNHLIRLDRNWLNLQGHIKKGGCYNNTNIKYSTTDLAHLNFS